MTSISRGAICAGLCLVLAACNAPSAVLMKNPSALTHAAIDSVAYALIDGAWTEEAWMSQRVIAQPVNYDMPLCHASQLHQITPEMWDGACLLAVSSRNEACDNWSGCVAMEFHPSVVDDPLLWPRIVRSISDICENIPKQGAEVWTGFRYDPARARRFLGCTQERPAHSQFVKRVELRASGRQSVLIMPD